MRVSLSTLGYLPWRGSESRANVEFAFSIRKPSQSHPTPDLKDRPNREARFPLPTIGHSTFGNSTRNGSTHSAGAHRKKSATAFIDRGRLFRGQRSLLVGAGAVAVGNALVACEWNPKAWEYRA